MKFGSLASLTRGHEDFVTTAADGSTGPGSNSALSGWDARTVNTVHDEIVVEAREDQAEEVKHLVEAAMLDAGKAILKEVPIVADAAVADYWSK